MKARNQQEYEDHWQRWQNGTDEKLTKKLTKDDQQPVLLLSARWSERRRIRKEAKGSQCAGKRSGDRATSNAQCAKSMLRLGFTRIAAWQTRKKKLSRKLPPEYQGKKTNVKCN